MSVTVSLLMHNSNYDRCGQICMLSSVSSLKAFAACVKDRSDTPSLRNMEHCQSERYGLTLTMFAVCQLDLVDRGGQVQTTHSLTHASGSNTKIVLKVKGQG